MVWFERDAVGGGKEGAERKPRRKRTGEGGSARRFGKVRFHVVEKVKVFFCWLKAVRLWGRSSVRVREGETKAKDETSVSRRVLIPLSSSPVRSATRLGFTLVPRHKRDPKDHAIE